MIFELFMPKNSNRLATELALVYLKEKKKKKKRDLSRTEVKTHKKKSEKNQTAPCESRKPFSDGGVDSSV